MADHALLSPSGASRWLACTRSAKWEASFENTSSSAAEEGTLAHELCELYLNNFLKRISPILYKKKLAKIKSNGFYCKEMDDHCQSYLTYVSDVFADLIDPSIFIEYRLDLTHVIPEGFGTGDCVMISDGILHIVDLKYGKGVKVDAFENKQLMLYAAAALNKHFLSYHLNKVILHIYQPRIDNFSTYEIMADELLEWIDTYVKPRANLAFKGEGLFEAGSHCKFCKARNECKTLANFNLEGAKLAFDEPNRLSNIEISNILEKAADLKVWLTSVQDFALSKALEGKKFPGFKLVLGRSVRQFTDKEAIIKAFKKAELSDELYLSAPALLGIGALEKNIGKPKIEEVIGLYITKPEGAPTLVPEWDKRTEIKSIEATQNAFKNIN